MQGEGFEVDGRAAGSRLDAFLGERLGLSRAETRRLLARGVVRVDGRARDAGAKGERLLMGARVEVAPFTPRADQCILPAPELALTVLAEGPDWLALDKPPGMPVHPYREDERATAAGYAVHLRPQMQGVGEGGLRSGVVHRLDVDTSGVLLLATQDAAWRRLRRAFRRHRVAKRYRAIALGDLEESGRVELDLRVARHRPARVAVAEPGRARAQGRVRQTRLAWRVAAGRLSRRGGHGDGLPAPGARHAGSSGRAVGGRPRLRADARRRSQRRRAAHAPRRVAGVGGGPGGEPRSAGLRGRPGASARLS